MTDEQRKKIERKITILSGGVMVLAVAFLILIGVMEKADSLLFPVGLSAFLIVYWVISDVVSVVWLKLFEGRTAEQKKAYYTYALLDAVGFAGLIYFIVDMSGMTGAIVFAACVMLKRRFHDEFYGITKDEDKAAAADTQESVTEEAPEAIEAADPQNEEAAATEPEEEAK